MTGTAPCRPHPFGPLSAARFVRRDNRFRLQADLNGRRVVAHIANPGRMRELLTPGRRLWLRRVDAPHRRTTYDVVLADADGHLVSLDAQLPNRLVADALREGCLSPFAAYTTILREVRRGESRLDFLLTGGEPLCWLEVKSVTLVENGIAAFPDAPTVRGRRHLHALMEIAAQGERAVVLFVVQRDDALALRPNDATDPHFGETLRQAIHQGVELYAYRCTVTLTDIRLQETIPITLTPSPAPSEGPTTMV